MGHWDGLQPFGPAAEDGHNVPNALAFWKGADNVNVKLSESGGRYFKNSRLRVNCFCWFDTLTCVTAFDEFRYVLIHFWPKVNF